MSLPNCVHGIRITGVLIQTNKQTETETHKRSLVPDSLDQNVGWGFKWGWCYGLNFILPKLTLKS